MTVQRVLAVLLADKKRNKLPLDSLVSRCDLQLLVLTPFSWRQQLDDLFGRGLLVHCLLHKLVDFFGEAPSLFSGYREYISARLSEGKIVEAIDDFGGMNALQDRIVMLEGLGRLLEQYKLPFSIPEWASSIAKAEDSWYPLLAKPVDACGSQTSHLMQLLPSPVLASVPDAGHIFQRFIPHHAVLYKVYVIGDHVDIVLRASVTEWQLFSGTLTTFEYGVTVPKEPLESASEVYQSAMARLGPHLANVRALVDRVRDRFKLTLFGVDLIIEEHSSKCHAIDINYFPGFDGVSDLDRKLQDALSLS